MRKANDGGVVCRLNAVSLPPTDMTVLQQHTGETDRWNIMGCESKPPPPNHGSCKFLLGFCSFSGIRLCIPAGFQAEVFGSPHPYGFRVPGQVAGD